jgi:ergothioneine biosynthesis protein EgtB
MKPDSSRIEQADLARRYRAVRDGTECLALGLSAEDCAAQSMPDASPVKWHMAHTTWFFETFVLEQHAARHQPFRPEFRYLFNSYYNALGEQFSRPQRGLLTRPALEEIRAYRRHVDERIQDLLAGSALAAPVLELIELGINHEQQHQELTVTDLLHLFSLNPLFPVYRESKPETRSSSKPLHFMAVAAGDVEIGHDGTGFAFDNELPRHRAHVPGFEIASRPASNAEFLAFVADGGYQRAEFWLSDGWALVKAQQWRQPLYWREAGGMWQEFTLQGLQPLDPARPVTHISQFEADAYASWAGARLPTEYEWETAAPAFRHGDVWEWTSSAYGPYPGFRPGGRKNAGAVGEYNGKFMSNQYVLRGGSAATPVGHARRSYRNFFPSSARWQFSGVRLARDAAV